MFDRLGVFTDPFDDAAAAAVCDGDADVLPALRNLEAASLVRVSADAAGEPRFRLLDTVRQIALRRLHEAGLLTDVEMRHGAWFAARATAAADDLRSRTFNNADASARLADRNVVVAFERAVDRGDAELAGRVAAALASYGIQAGLLRDSAARLRRALSMGEMSPGVRSDVLMALVNLRAALGDVADQARDGQEALSLARRAGSDIRVVRALIALGSYTQLESIERLTEAGEMAERIGYSWGATRRRGTTSVTRSRLAADSRRRSRCTAGPCGWPNASGDLAGASLSLMARAAAELELGNTDRGLADVREASRRLPADGGGSGSFRLWTGTTLAEAEAAAGLDAEAAATLAGTIGMVLRLDLPLEYDAWLDGAFAVLAKTQPLLAAKCLGALDDVKRSDGSVMSSSRPNRRSPRGSSARWGATAWRRNAPRGGASIAARCSTSSPTPCAPRPARARDGSPAHTAT